MNFLELDLREHHQGTSRPHSCISPLKAIFIIELKRNLWTRRALFLYLMALAPVLLLLLRMVFPPPQVDSHTAGEISVGFGLIFRTLFLRLLVFFGSIGVFVNLFRGEMVQGTLHYYFLSPVPRELILMGKYLAGVFITGLLFGSSVLVSYYLLFQSSGIGLMELSTAFHVNAFTYLGVTWLACVGYGALFLLTGLYFRNPIIPAAVILGWESINYVLPAALKQISVIYYLESLCPVPMPQGPFALLAAPAPFWGAITGLLMMSLLCLLLGSYHIRGLEIRYSQE